MNEIPSKSHEKKQLMKTKRKMEAPFKVHTILWFQGCTAKNMAP